MAKFKEVRKYMVLFGGWNCSVVYIDQTFTIRVFGGEFASFLEKIHQKPKKKIMNSELYDVLPQLMSFQSTLHRVFDSKKAEAIEGQFDFDGTIIWLEIRLKYWEDENIPAIIMLISDKTEEHKASDELKKTNASLRMLFSIIAHDVKTPLNSIDGFTGLLLDSAYPEDKQKEFLNIISVSAKKMSRIVSDLGQWIDAYSGKVSPNMYECYPMLLIEQIVKSHNNSSQKKNITIVSSIPNVCIYSDESMMARILDNLIANAIKFTRQDGKISVSVQESEREFIFCIEDNGIGMDQEKLGRLFKIDETQYLSTPGTNKEAGTGFGLILCKSLVDLLQARIWCESKVGAGTSFFLAIPKKD